MKRKFNFISYSFDPGGNKKIKKIKVERSKTKKEVKGKYLFDSLTTFRCFN